MLYTDTHTNYQIVLLPILLASQHFHKEVGVCS